MKIIRKKVYLVLKALHRGDMVFHMGCKLDEISPRVKNEIYELRSIHGIKIETTSPSNYGRSRIFYFLEHSKENCERAKILLDRYEKQRLKQIPN